MSSADTAAYDRLSAKQAYFDTIILAAGTSTGTGNVALQNSPTFNGMSTSGIIGSGDFGDLTLTSARNIFLTATNAVTIGSNTFPNGTGTVGQILTTNGAGSVTWTTPPGTGTVTSVAASVPAFLSIAGSPIIGAGTLAITLSGTALPVLNGGTGTTTSTGTGSVVLSASPTMTGALTIPQITGSGGGFGDLTFSSARNIILSASTAIAIGATNFPLGAGSVGQVLMTNGVGVATWSASPTLAEITGSGAGFGDFTVTSARNIYLNAATSVVIGSNTYPVAVGAAGQVLTTNGAPGVVSWQTPTASLINYAMYGGTSPMPEADTSYKPPNTISTIGTPLSYNASNGNFTNNTGFPILITMGYSCARNSNSFGFTSFGFELNGVGGRTYACNNVGAIDYATGTVTLALPNTEFFRLVSAQTSGSGNDYFAGSTIWYQYRTY